MEASGNSYSDTAATARSREGAFVKVCGIQSKEEADAALQNGATAVGFLYVPTAMDRIDAPGVDKTVDADPATYPSADALAVGKVIADYVHKKYPFARVVLVTHEWGYKKIVPIAAEIGADAIQLHDYIPPFDLPKLKYEASVASLHQRDMGSGLMREEAEALVSAKQAPAIEAKYGLKPQDAEKLIDVYVWFAKDFSGWSSVSLTRRMGGLLAIALKRKHGLSKIDAKQLGLAYAGVAAERINNRKIRNLKPSAATYVAVALAQTRGISLDDARNISVDIPTVELFKAIHVLDHVDPNDVRRCSQAVLANAKQYISQGVDAFFVDTMIDRGPSGRTRIGGTGRRSDSATFRAVVAGLKGVPIIVAGGLHSGNVAQVVQEAQCAQLSAEGTQAISGTDANSRLEVNGAKNAELIRDFAAASWYSLERGANSLLRSSLSQRKTVLLPIIQP